LKESDIQNQILIELSKQGTVAFRINAGSFWAGEIMSNKDNMLLLKNPRKVQGAPEGTSDIIGITSIEITTEMVGRRVGVFTAIEVKSPERIRSLTRIIFLRICVIGERLQEWPVRRRMRLGS